MRFIKKNIRYILAFGVMGLAFLLSNNFFVDYTVKSSDCADGKCRSVLAKADISDENISYYINDIVKTKKGEYYRLIFEEKSTRSSFLKTELAKATEEKMDIKSLEIKQSDDFSYHEVIFAAQADGLSDLVFTKENLGDGSRIDIRNVKMTRLNVNNEKELFSLKPTVLGKVQTNAKIAEQLSNEKKFNQLKEDKTILGQVFKAEGDYIFAVSLDIDVTRNDNRGGKKYRLELRNVDFDGETYTIKSSPIASLSFTAKSLEDYRQNDGKMKFPLGASVKKGEYYFIGIDNEKVTPDRFNFLTLHGSDNSKYSEGSGTVKKDGNVYQINGDLYFMVYGTKFEKIGEDRILSGAIIEDIGKGKGIYFYDTAEKDDGLVDLEDYSDDVEYDQEDGIIHGTTDSRDSFFSYELFMAYPFHELNIKAAQADSGWAKCKILFSLDNEKWQEVPYAIDGTTYAQVFDWKVMGNDRLNKAYLKIVPEETKETESGLEKTYGIKDLKIEGSLVIK